MVLKMSITLTIEPAAELLPGRGCAPAVPTPPPLARADRPPWRQLLFAWFEEDPDDPTR